MAPNSSNKVTKSGTPKKAAETDPASKSSSSAGAKSAPALKKSHAIEYEFGGPIGALAVVVFLPLVVYALFFLCNKDNCVGDPMVFDWQLWMNKK
jgi:Delta14-sterol reductase